MFKIGLGEEVKDKITGFKGIIVGRSDFITGCKQYDIKPQGLTKEGKIKDGCWLDEDRLVRTGKKINISSKKTIKEGPGGPHDEGHSHHRKS